MTEAPMPTPTVSYETQLALVNQQLNGLATSVNQIQASVNAQIQLSQSTAVDRARVDTLTDSRVTSAHQRLDAEHATLAEVLRQIPGFATTSQVADVQREIGALHKSVDEKDKAQTKAIGAAVTDITGKMDDQAEAQRRDTKDLPTIRNTMLWVAGVLTIVAGGVLTGFITGHLSIAIH